MTAEARPRPPAITWLGLVGIVLVAVNLRPAITAVGPLVDELRHDTGASAGVLGLLTTLPVVAFASVATWAVRVGGRLGLETAILVATIALGLGIAVRLPGSLPSLFAGTLLIGAGVGVLNVLLPSLVKRDHERHYASVTAGYSSVLVAFAALGAGLSVPITNLLGDWRLALAVWALPALAAALFWVPRASGVRPVAAARHIVTPAVRSLRHSRLAWAVTGFFGFQAFGFYAAVAWFPAMVMDHGVSAEAAGWLFAFVQMVGVGATFLAPAVCGWIGAERGAVYITGVALTAGWLGLAVAGSGGLIICAALIGAGLGAGFGLGLLFIGLHASDSRASAALSGMAQGYGYLIAATAPFLVGTLHDLTKDWDTSIVVVVVAGLVQTGLGCVAGRKRRRAAPAFE